MRYIRRLYSLRARNGKRLLTLRLISDRLYMKGIPPKSTKQGSSVLARWSLAMLSKIINNARKTDQISTSVCRAVFSPNHLG